VENAPEFGLILRKYIKKKLILHLHNDSLNVTTRRNGDILSSYDAVFTLSEYVNNRVQEIDFNNKNIKTLYNGIDLNKFNCTFNSEQNLKLNLGINQDDVVLMYVGRLVEEKGVKELISAFNNISFGREVNAKLIV